MGNDILSYAIEYSYSQLPKDSGVYLVYNAENEVLYVGKSNNIRYRLRSHANCKEDRPLSNYIRCNGIGGLAFKVIPSNVIADFFGKDGDNSILVCESELILSLDPALNIRSGSMMDRATDPNETLRSSLFDNVAIF